MEVFMRHTMYFRSAKYVESAAQTILTFNLIKRSVHAMSVRFLFTVNYVLFSFVIANEYECAEMNVTNNSNLII